MQYISEEKLDISNQNLNDEKLKEILTGIEKSENITEINFSGNQLTAIPIELLAEKFPNLEKLDISKNKIAKIPYTI